MSRRRRFKTHENVTCQRVSDDPEKQEEYQYKVPVSSTELNYQGQKLNVNVEQFNDLRILTDGDYGYLFISNIDGQSNTEMTVQRLPLQYMGGDRLCCPADLATLESLNSKNCPYILAYYGAIVDKNSAHILLCMESMDASMGNFCTTIHSLDNLTNVVEWKHILCRLINHVASALNFLTNNDLNYQFLSPSTILVNKQALFKLCGVGITIQDRYFDDRPYIPYSYYSNALMLKQAGYDVHPGMWAFGLNLFEILIGQYPFRNMNIFSFLQSIQTWTPTFPSNQINLDEIQQIIIQLLKTNKQQQPQNYTEILEIPCIKDVNETASNAELELVVRIIDKISVQSD